MTHLGNTQPRLASEHTHHLRSQALVTIGLVPQQARALRDVVVAQPRTLGELRAREKLPGDSRSLRGIPVVARGVAGVSPNTMPGANLK